MDKYSVYLDTPEQDWFGDFYKKEDAMAFFNTLDYHCDKYCIGKDKVLYCGGVEIARATIKDLTVLNEK